LPQSTPGRSSCHFKKPSKSKYPRLLDPAYSLRINQIRKVCASRTLAYCPLRLSPPGADAWLLLRLAARARSGACKRRMGFATPYPAFRARSLPPQSTATRHCQGQPLSPVQPVILKAAGVQNPAVRFASIGRAVCAGLICRWGRPSHTAKRFSRISVEVHFHAVLFSRQPTPCEARLFTQRPKTAYVFTAVPRTSSSPQRPADRHGLSVHLPRPPPVARCGLFAECSHMHTRASR